MMKKERFKIVPAAYLVLKKDDEVLLYLRQNSGFADGLYGLVSGHLEGGEPALEAMRREALEEIGITLKPEDLKMVLTVHRIDGERESVDFFFAADQWQGEISNREPHVCAGIEFCATDNLPGNTIPYIKAALENIAKGISYMEWGWHDRISV